MYKPILIDEELPPLGKWVTTIDEVGNHRVYRLTENGWNMRDAGAQDSISDNAKITHWLKEGNLFLLEYHLSRRSDEGCGYLALIFASNLKEATDKLIKEKSHEYTDAISSCTVKPDHIVCLNID